MSSAIDFSAVTLEGLRQSPQVLHGMELALTGEAETWPRVKVFEGRPGRPFHDNARPLGSMIFLFQFAGIIHRRNEQVAIQALKITGNAIRLDDGLNRIDGSR